MWNLGVGEELHMQEGEKRLRRVRWRSRFAVTRAIFGESGGREVGCVESYACI